MCTWASISAILPFHAHTEDRLLKASIKGSSSHESHEWRDQVRRYDMLFAALRHFQTSPRNFIVFMSRLAKEFHFVSAVVVVVVVILG